MSAGNSAALAPRELVVLGDFHLASGRDPLTGAVAPREPFHDDGALARFLDHLAVDVGRRRLLIIGDLLDFSRVDLPGLRADAVESDAVTLRKLDRIAAGHPEAFAALGRASAAGVEIHLVPGNHDFQLGRPAALERLGRLLARYGGRTTDPAPVRLHPWIYYEPGFVFAEHGHQYHDVNCFPGLLELGQAHGLTDVRPPLGWYLDRRRLRLARGLLGELARLRSPSEAARRQAYRARFVAPQAEATGLSAGALERLDRLSERARRDLLRRALATLTRAPEARTPYMQRAASAIDRLLRRSGEAVPFYVFGHTHAAARTPLRPDADHPVYLNAGTWSAISHRGSAADSTGPRRALHFLELRFDPGGGPAALLRRWNDSDQRVESLGGPQETTAGVRW
jgi:UDP-2,3-diacylglucosamine pyrophosphatase LpxH